MGEERTEKTGEGIQTTTVGTKSWLNKSLDIFKGLFSNKVYMWLFIAIILLALGLRVFYFIGTNGQTSWWDSAEYLSQGAHYLNGWNGATDNFEINFQRPPAFQYLVAICLGIGLGESQIIFLLCLIPSLLLVFLTYLLGREMFNEKIGLIASIFMAFCWNMLFWTPRAQPDFISMCLQVGALYFFFKCVNNRGSLNWNMFIAGALAAASFSFKISGLLIPIVIFVYLCATQRFNIVKKKENWMFVLGFAALIIPYLIWAWASFGNPFIVRSGYKSSFENHDPFAWWTLNFFYIFFSDKLFFLLFLLGIGWTAWSILSKIDLELKSPSKEFPARLFTILLFLITACFYIFYIGGIEDRWIFIWLPFLFFIAAWTAIWVFDILHLKVHKVAAWAFIILLVAFLGYGQVMNADALIKNKISSYAPVKEASIWMKDNSYASESIMTLSYTQMFFYSQRPIYTYSNVTPQQFEELYKSVRPKFLVVSVFEPQSQWIFTWVQNNSAVTPVMGYFNDPPQNTQPVLIIYKFNYDLQ